MSRAVHNAFAAALLLAAACGGSGAAPTVTEAPQGATAVQGDTATFTVAASGSGLTYQWLRNGAPIAGATNASYTTPPLTADDDGAAYTVQVKGDGGSTVSAPAKLHVNWLRIDTQPQDTGVATGTGMTLAVGASGSGTITYQWKKNGANLPAATGASFHLEVALSIDEGNYTCVVTSSLGGTQFSVESRPAALGVLAAPKVSAQPQPLTVAAGGTATFTVIASASDSLSYQWQKDGADISGATSPTLALPSVTAANVGSYRAVVTSSRGKFAVQAVSAAAALAVVTPPTVAPLSDRLIAEGGALLLGVSATAAANMPATQYQWRKDSVDIPNAIGSSLAIATVGTSDAGVYTCVLSTSLNGVTASSLATSTVTVVPKPVIVTQPSGAAIDPGVSFTLSVSATGADALGYQWMLNGSPIPGATSATYTVAAAGALDAGSYTCRVSNTRQGVSAFATSDGAMLTVSAPPTIVTQPADASVHESETATFTVVVAGSNLTYQWYRGDAAIPGATDARYTTSAVDLIADQGATFHCLVSNGHPPDVVTRTATLTVSPFPTSFDASVTTLTSGEGAILTWRFVGTATLQEGNLTPAPVTSGQSSVVYPLADTTWTLTVTNHGVTSASTRTVAVKTYVPKHLYVLNTYPSQTPAPPPDSIAHFTVTLQHGGLPGEPDRYAPPGAVSGANPAQRTPTGKFPIHVAASPDESHLYVSNNGDGTVSAYSVSPSTGVLTEVAGSPFSIVGDTQPFASAVDPSGAHLYVACKDGVRVFAIDASSGALTAAPTLDAPIPGRVEGDLLMHPSGRFLYVADHGHDAIQVYAVDAGSGALTGLTSAPSTGGPTGLTFDRAGARLFSRGTDATPVAGTSATYNAALHMFAVDPFAGTLTEISTYRGYGPNRMLVGNAKTPFVLGMDAHLHGLAYSKKPGVEALYDAYTGDLSGGWQGFSMSAFDVDASGIVGDRIEGNQGSPFMIDVWQWQSVAGSVFTDRSGAAVLLTTSTSTVSVTVYFPTDPVDGNLLGNSGAVTTQVAFLRAGVTQTLVNQTHGVFTGTLQ